MKQRMWLQTIGGELYLCGQWSIFFSEETLKKLRERENKPKPSAKAEGEKT